MRKGYYKLHFDDLGHLVYKDEQDAIIRSLLDVSRDVTDLWIFSHGWNTNEQGADHTYDTWVEQMQEQIQQEKSIGYHPMYVGIYWPSMAWVDLPTNETALLTSSPGEYRAFDIDPSEFEMDVDEITMYEEQGRLEVAQAEMSLETGGNASDITTASESSIDAEDKAQFVEVYRAAMDPRGEHAGSFDQDFARIYEIVFQSPQATSVQVEEFIRILYRYKVDDPDSELFEDINILNALESVIAHLNAQINATTVNEGFQPDSILFKFFHSFTFWTMKGRAAIIGQQGAAPFLRRVKLVFQQSKRNVRLHLLGHSFGAKLLSAAVKGLVQHGIEKGRN